MTWNKVELGENFELTISPCLESKFKALKARAAPQDTGYRRAMEEGRVGYQKRGRETHNRNLEGSGDMVHNTKLKRHLQLDKQNYAPLIHNFVRHRDNNKWVITRSDIPQCLKFHLLGHCWKKFDFGHKDLNPREEQGMEALINMAKDLQISQRRNSGGMCSPQRGQDGRFWNAELPLTSADESQKGIVQIKGPKKIVQIKGPEKMKVPKKLYTKSRKEKAKEKLKAQDVLKGLQVESGKSTQPPATAKKNHQPPTHSPTSSEANSSISIPEASTSSSSMAANIVASIIANLPPGKKIIRKGEESSVQT